MFNDLWYRLRALVRRTASENELDAELNFHFDRQVEKNTCRGMPREEAVREARMVFGSMTQVKEDCRRAWGTVLIETLVQDILASRLRPLFLAWAFNRSSHCALTPPRVVRTDEPKTGGFGDWINQSAMSAGVARPK